MEKLILALLLVLPILVLSAVPAVAHGSCEVSADLFYGSPFGADAATLCTINHNVTGTKVTLQRRPDGGVWHDVAWNTNTFFDTNASYAHVRAGGFCRGFDYRARGDGWQVSETGNLHNEVTFHSPAHAGTNPC
jgi:hypothetical protein